MPGNCPTDRAKACQVWRVERARRILHSSPTRTARDAIHIAVMHARDIDRVMSFDRGFDGIPGIQRLE
jgi:predicted nucleic acid-binding protein